MDDQAAKIDPELRIPTNKEATDAANEIAATAAGVIFFTWLSNRCFYNRSTIVGNPDTFEVNTLGSVAQEFVRRIYLDIRRGIKPELRKKIENKS